MLSPEYPQMNDFEYVDKIFCELAEKEEDIGLDALSHNEKVIITVWHATGLISSGGLTYFFVWKDANPNVADYFEEIGMANAATIIRQFFSLFSINKYDDFSSADRDDYIEENIEKVKDKVDFLNREILAQLPIVEEKTATYIRENLRNITFN